MASNSDLKLVNFAPASVFKILRSTLIRDSEARVDRISGLPGILGEKETTYLFLLISRIKYLNSVIKILNLSYWICERLNLLLFNKTEWRV